MISRSLFNQTDRKSVLILAFVAYVVLTFDIHAGLSHPYLLGGGILRKPQGLKDIPTLFLWSTLEMCAAKMVDRCFRIYAIDHKDRAMILIIKICDHRRIRFAVPWGPTFLPFTSHLQHFGTTPELESESTTTVSASPRV